MNESLALLLLSGTSPVPLNSGWCVREAYCLRCKLCCGQVNPRDVPGHAHGHCAAIAEQYNVFCTLVAMAEYEYVQTRAKTSISDLVETVFGFRPGTPAATEFWKQHGGTDP